MSIFWFLHHSRARTSLSSRWPTAAVWKARAMDFFMGMSKLSLPPKDSIKSFTCECRAEYENASLLGIGRGSGGIEGHFPSESSAQNFSRASPGPSLVHLSCKSLETLSNDLPMLSSAVVARSLNEFTDVARRSKVCPPDIKRVRKGKFGSWGHAVRRGVNACPCWKHRLVHMTSKILRIWKYHMINTN